MTRQDHDPQHRTGRPHEVDSLLAESLQTTAAEDFDWKEPERGPRWWERAEAQGQVIGAPASGHAVSRHPDEEAAGLRPGQLVFGTICFLLALWCLLGVVLGVTVDPLLVGLGICTLAGLILIAAGLRPRRGRRLGSPRARRR